MSHANGTYNVACCYHFGVGIEKDGHNAFEYYQKSAEMGHVEGIYNVGYCYFNGIGVEKDENMAFKYLKRQNGKF